MPGGCGEVQQQFACCLGVFHHRGVSHAGQQLYAGAGHGAVGLRRRGGGIPRVPVLVIFGTEDARYPSSSASGYATVPEARIELLAGVGHTPMLEDPQATVRLLAGFAASAAD